MTDFSELKRLAEEVNSAFPGKEDLWSMVCTPTVALDLIAENERLKHFESAFCEWIDKTDWVQKSCHWSDLGMHRADVLRKRIDQLTAENEALRKALTDVRSAVQREYWDEYAGLDETRDLLDAAIGKEAQS
jgi:CRISPR/Cas system-associated endoribonuclease Cas2